VVQQLRTVKNVVRLQCKSYVIVETISMRLNAGRTNVVRAKVVTGNAIRANVARTNVVRSNVFRMIIVRTNVVRTNVVRMNVVRTDVVKTNVVKTNDVKTNVFLKQVLKLVKSNDLLITLVFIYNHKTVINALADYTRESINFLPLLFPI